MTQPKIKFLSAIFIVICVVCGLPVFSQDSIAVLSSPGRALSISFQTGGDNKEQSQDQLYYSVSLKGKKLLNFSKLSLDISGAEPLGAHLHMINSRTSSVDKKYELVTGKAKRVHDHYNSMELEFAETTTTKRKVIIEARAYDDAVAFRYIVPAAQGLDSFRLNNENTEFHFSKDAVTYAQVLPNYKSMYESEYLKLPVSAFSNQGGVKSSITIGLPLLAEVPGVGWAAIAEAELKGYTSMYLTNPSGGWSGHTLLSRLSPSLDSTGVAVNGKYPLQTPWRIIMAAENPGTLVESNVVMSLSAASALENTSWIKAGKASWDWWSGSIDKDGKSSYTTENMKYYVDFASKAGLEYMLVDAGWSGNDITKMDGKVDIPALVEYGKTRNVKIWIWLYAGAVAKQMEEAFPLYEKWGVAGVKIDFVERDDQEGIAFYYKVAEQSAAHHLMVDFHGCTKPFGLERTYPNIMNYESVLGLEQSKGGSRDNPENRAMLPFTRMLTGPMDFTPGGFDNVSREAFIARSDKPMVMGTRSHQLALYVVYQAPFEMVSDHPAAYEKQPEFAFIKQVPATWDETKVLNGLPGEYITIARRKNSDWYIGSITNWQARDFKIPMTFLQSGSYLATIYADAPDAGRNPKHTVITTRTINNKTILPFKLAEGGGCSIYIRPAK